MVKIIKFAKESWLAIVAILALLVIQANCELALPQYTSDIVDVGIQSGGIETAAPEAVRASTLEHMKLFLTDEEAARMEADYKLVSKDSMTENDYSAYVKKYPAAAAEDIYVRNHLSQEELEELGTLMTPAEMMMLLFSSDGAEAVQMRDAMLSGMGMDPAAVDNIFEVLMMLPQEAMDQMKAGIQEEMQGVSDTMAKQMAVSFVKSEYIALGVDVDHYQMNYLGKTGVKMLGLALLGMVVSVLVGLLAARAAARTGRDLRNRVFHKVIGFSNGEMDKFSTASLITRSTNDIQQIQMVTVMLLRMVAYAPIIGIGGIIKVLQTNTSMTWIIAVAVGTIFCLVMVLMAVAMPKFKMMQKLVDRLNLVAREILTGIPVIRAFSREKHEEERFDAANKDLMKTQLFTNRAMSFMMPAMMLIMNGITVLIVWVGAHGIDLGNLQVGDMMAFITYTMQIVMAFLMITMISIMLPRAAVSAERIDEILKTDPEIRDKQNARAVPLKGKGEIRFNHVSFRYPNADEDVLEDIDFTAKPGETTAIIGSTGSGKSTLVQLIPRLYDVTKGSITMDGVDIRDLTQHDLREEIGYVPQKGVLFSGTIASNLRFGAEDAADQQIAEAARIAQAADFIEEKPEKYDSPIAQGGTNVSGGQKQRLSIARAIAKNPKVYVFDDSFSALDYKTDIALRKALKSAVAESTVIIVAQRISTIIHAEKILVLDEGRIVGMGTHEELLKDNEVYRQIAMSQLSAKELEGKTGVDEAKEVD
ncbi:ABC transporter ATP-binding protein [Lachnotalea sp. AF33-28]|uniref:ABC transporter ATP-binding protein n=1 Tax=Lachnotalea sp. AF33-28 TaxID=2292046 RepID=UPI000E48A62D|nr:ABC transporter ATP-binding protein [Lachnotalea sp. AF33-28]RHP34460.1 ABC transporter ATP-binding protein [Lachnotalea sp. AF33-28]